MSFDMQSIASLRLQLDNHPVYGAIRSIEDLRVFMQHHIYSVWDFMSLIKFLQAEVASTDYPWTPAGDTQVKRFISELVLEEECDEAPLTLGGKDNFISHFELYCHAMREIGADTQPVLTFLDIVAEQGIDVALKSADIPAPSKQFTRTTFDFIQSGKPHAVAAALALGREHIIPNMFRHLLANMGIDEKQAPSFHYYLHRHIHLDEDFHAPLSLRLLEVLCDDNAEKQEEAVEFAQAAIRARLLFWDGVLESLQRKAA